MNKHEWRKKEKAFYLPKNQPEIVDIPEFNFITLSGEGNPNTQAFSDRIGVLYALSYAIKMNLKKLADKPNGYTDYSVYPLEGIWDLKEEAKKQYNGTLNKDDLVYRIMIRQPHFVDEDFYRSMLALTKEKKPNALLDHAIFEKITDGKCIQMLHLGSYDDEPASFAKMEEFAASSGLTRASKQHREIYLSDFRKVPAHKLKTVLRFQVH